MNARRPIAGLRENAPQFALLVFINALTGSLIGLERAILPPLAEGVFGLTAKTAALSFIAAFGLAKALANYGAGQLADARGRRSALIAGWLLALPAPVMLIWAPSWGWVVAANLLLGASQGLAWSAAVIMKIDLAGPKQRGLAMGLNEAAGYIAVGLAALASGYLAATWGPRPWPFVAGLLIAGLGAGLSLAFARETRGFVGSARGEAQAPTGLLRRVTFIDPTLSSACQAGLANNLNDGLAWGLLPLVYAAAGLDLAQIGLLAGLYPAVWGLGQLAFGPLSDRWGRRGLISWGMAIQALGLGLAALSRGAAGFAASSILLGLGTAMVYPTLLAAVGDAAEPGWRARAVGIYRLWRDSGYVVGALFAGLLADLAGLEAALWGGAALTLASGLVARIRMPRGARPPAEGAPWTLNGEYPTPGPTNPARSPSQV